MTDWATPKRLARAVWVRRAPGLNWPERMRRRRSSRTRARAEAAGWSVGSLVMRVGRGAAERRGNRRLRRFRRLKKGNREGAKSAKEDAKKRGKKSAGETPVPRG